MFNLEATERGNILLAHNEEFYLNAWTRLDDGPNRWLEVSYRADSYPAFNVSTITATPPSTTSAPPPSKPNSPQFVSISTVRKMRCSSDTIARRELGTLAVDAGDVVCFSMDAVIRMAGGPDDVEDFIARHRGVCCEFNADGGYGVDALNVSDTQGDIYHAVVIGLPNNFLRFLNENEPTLDEWLDRHPDYAQVGKRTAFNAGLPRRICDEYAAALLDGSVRRKYEQFGSDENPA